MKPDTRFLVKDPEFWMILFGPLNGGKLKVVNLLWLRAKLIKQNEIEEFVTRGILVVVGAEVEEPVAEPIAMAAPHQEILNEAVSLQSARPSKNKSRRGRPPKNAQSK